MGPRLSPWPSQSRLSGLVHEAAQPSKPFGCSACIVVFRGAWGTRTIAFSHVTIARYQPVEPQAGMVNSPIVTCSPQVLAILAILLLSKAFLNRGQGSWGPTMNRFSLAIPNLIGLATLALSAVLSLSAAERPRLAVLTDIGGDPDDQQSMVRLMVYANEFEIEALVASASGTPGRVEAGRHPAGPDPRDHRRLRTRAAEPSEARPWLAGGRRAAAASQVRQSAARPKAHWRRARHGRLAVLGRADRRRHCRNAA